MGMKITELVSWRLPRGILSPAAHRETWQSAMATLKAQPGFLGAWSGMQQEPDAQGLHTLHLYVDWEMYEAHERFMNSPVYLPFKQQLSQLIDGDSLFMLHVPFPTDLAPILHSPITEVLTLVTDAVLELDPLQEAIRQAVGCHGLVSGWAREEHEGKTHVMLVGWDSLEAHMAFRQTDAFTAAVPAIRGPQVKAVSMRHVSFQSTIT